MAFGSFDILHPGHVDYLSKAKHLGDFLIVVVARDSSIKAIKGKTPFFDENERLLMVKSLKIVDSAVIGSTMKTDDDKYSIVKKFRPDIVAFGYDQKVDMRGFKDWLKKNGMTLRIVKMKYGLGIDKYKSSKVRRILEL